MARIINSGDLTPAALQALPQHDLDCIYNGLDCCVTLEVLEVLLGELDETSSETYAFSRALQGPIIDMAMRGIRIDFRKRDAVLAEFEARREKVGNALDRIIREGIGVDIDWNSPKQLMNLFYDVMQFKPVRKRNPKGMLVPTINRDAIEKLQSHYYAGPLCSHLLLLRDLNKKIGFLKTGIDPDGRIRASFNIAGTTTGRLSSSMSEFGTGCVRPTAEALTPTGWKPLGELKDGDSIAQWDNGYISFVPATFFWTTAKGLAQFNSEQTQLAITGGHRVLWRNYHDESYKTSAAKEVFGKRQIYIPLAGKAIGGTLEVPAYVAAFMADFSLEGTQIRGSFKKERKITRLMQLVNEYGLDCKEGQTNREGYRRFSISNETDWPRTWGPWVLSLTPESAEGLLEEAKHWDAHVRNDSFIFYTVDKTQAQWFQTLCHLTGRSATIRSRQNSDKAYGNNSIVYAVNVKPRTEAQLLSKHWEVIDYEGPVGCPQVPSSYWLVRENGFISVTGNTNLQNVDRDLKKIFIADPGYKFVNLDLEQGDSRNVGAIIWNLFYESHGATEAGKYLDACESGDLHTTVCSMAWSNLPWPGDAKGNRDIADGIAYRNFSYRDLAKKLGHGSNYLGQPKTMAGHSKVEQPLIEDFQDRYFGAFPLIGSTYGRSHEPNWHNWVKQQIWNFGYITSLMGRRRFFYGNPADESTLREAVAYEPQSLTGDEINTGMLRIWRQFSWVQLLCQVHDSILLQVPEEMSDDVIQLLLDTLRITLLLKGGREFSVPTEAKVGWNWGDAPSEKEISRGAEPNPDGMIKWKGADLRRRTEHPIEKVGGKLTLRGIL